MNYSLLKKKVTVSEEYINVVLYTNMNKYLNKPDIHSFPQHARVRENTIVFYVVG